MKRSNNINYAIQDDYDEARSKFDYCMDYSVYNNSIQFNFKEMLEYQKRSDNDGCVYFVDYVNTIYLTPNQRYRASDVVSLSTLHNFVNVVTIHGSSVGIKQIYPDEIRHLNKLEILNLNYNELRDIQVKLPKNLKILSIKRNYLQKIPKYIGDLVNLVELDLSDNDIIKITPLAF